MRLKTLSLRRLNCPLRSQKWEVAQGGLSSHCHPKSFPSETAPEVASSSWVTGKTQAPRGRALPRSLASWRQRRTHWALRWQGASLHSPRSRTSTQRVQKVLFHGWLGRKRRDSGVQC